MAKKPDGDSRNLRKIEAAQGKRKTTQARTKLRVAVRKAKSSPTDKNHSEVVKAQRKWEDEIKRK